MSTVRGIMNIWGRQFLISKGVDEAEVPPGSEIHFEDYSEVGGYCETCSFTEYYVEVWITMGAVSGKCVVRKWNGNMADLLQEIMEWEDGV